MLEEAAEVNGKMTGKTLIGPLVCVDFFPAGRKTPKDEKSTNANMNPVNGILNTQCFDTRHSKSQQSIT